MPAFRMVIELAGMADIESIEELSPDTNDDSVELIIKLGDDETHMNTDFETAHQVLDKLEGMCITNHEQLKDFEYSGKHTDSHN
jgi:hypothetical protein